MSTHRIDRKADLNEAWHFPHFDHAAGKARTARPWVSDKALAAMVVEHYRRPSRWARVRSQLSRIGNADLANWLVDRILLYLCACLLVGACFGYFS